MAIEQVKIERSRADVGRVGQAQDVHDYRSAFDYDQVVALSGAATTNSDSIDLGALTVMSLVLTADTVTGTSPTVNVKIQTRANADESWVDAQAFTQLTAAGSERKRFNVDRYIRLVVTLGGTTPALTGTLSGTFMK